MRVVLNTDWPAQLAALCEPFLLNTNFDTLLGDVTVLSALQVFHCSLRSANSSRACESHPLPRIVVALYETCRAHSLA